MARGMGIECVPIHGMVIGISQLKREEAEQCK